MGGAKKQKPGTEKSPGGYAAYGSSANKLTAKANGDWELCLCISSNFSSNTLVLVNTRLKISSEHAHWNPAGEERERKGIFKYYGYLGITVN